MLRLGYRSQHSEPRDWWSTGQVRSVPLWYLDERNQLMRSGEGVGAWREMGHFWRTDGTSLARGDVFLDCV